MDRLNFPEYSFEIQIQGQKKLIFDLVRKKFIPLTPEEWVRQHCIAHLNQHYSIPHSNLAVEREIKVLNLRKRFDIVSFAKNGSPQILVECKAPHVPITQETIIQAGVYNKKMDSQWMWITNGIQHVWLQKTNDNIYFCDTPDTIVR
jgi:hypothetical protein